MATENAIFAFPNIVVSPFCHEPYWLVFVFVGMSSVTGTFTCAMAAESAIKVLPWSWAPPVLLSAGPLPRREQKMVTPVGLAINPSASSRKCNLGDVALW
jgi:hypothetical protein